MTRLLILAVTVLGAACAHRAAPEVAVRRDPVGCYAAAPALTYSATGEPELRRGDTTWASVRLDSAGKASRPLRPARYDDRSSWRIESDTLAARFFDGLVGWTVKLTPSAEGWSGTAEYLTDARVMGGEPFRRAIVWTSRACGA